MGEPEERLADEVRALKGQSVEKLRALWRERFGDAPPPLRGPDLLARALAERIQFEARGRDAELDRRLAALVRAHGRGEAVKSPKAFFRAGTVLVREHQGRTHRVEVQDDGFLWEGKPYRSLSVIARAITGTRWNGPKFFGLRVEVVR